MTEVTIETSLELTDIKSEARDSIIGQLIEHKTIEFIDGMNFIHGETDLEIDCEFIASVVPYDKGRGPSFDNAGGDPPEGGYCEDESLTIVCLDGHQIDVTDLVDSRTIENLSVEAYEYWNEDSCER